MDTTRKAEATKGRRLLCLIGAFALPAVLGAGCGGGRLPLLTVDAAATDGRAERGSSGGTTGRFDGPVAGGGGGTSVGPGTGSGGSGGLATGGAGGTTAGGSGGRDAGPGSGGRTGTGGTTAVTGVQAGGRGGAGGGSGGVTTIGRDGGGTDVGAPEVRPDASDGATDGARADGDTAIPLWRNSYGSFSEAIGNGFVLSVWSDDRGVFVLGQDAWDAPPRVWSNLGVGWQSSYTWPEGTTVVHGAGWIRLRGFVDGPLVALSISPCSIQFIDSQGARCSGASREVADVATISAQLAYATYSNRLLRFDGSLWTQLGDPLPYVSGNSTTLWADSSTIAVVAEGRLYLASPGNQAVEQTGLSSFVVTTVWGFGSKDLWVGTRDGQLVHYDGAQWSAKASVAVDMNGITRLWGNDGQLFVLTYGSLVRWDGTRAVVLDAVTAPSAYVDLWGSSAKEVFAARSECSADGARCAYQMRWWNGATLGPL
jgi:hypothetical protein